jgi:hypothetical protein
MVNFRDPKLVYLDLCTYHAIFGLPLHAQDQRGPVLWQSPSSSSAIPWMVSTCESTPLEAPALRLCLTLVMGLGLAPNTRWEYFTTLDYECRVIQGRQPYRWTIWVCISGRFRGSSLSSHASETRADSLFGLALLPHAFYWAHGCDHQHRHSQSGDPN